MYFRVSFINHNSSYVFPKYNAMSKSLQLFKSNTLIETSTVGKLLFTQLQSKLSIQQSCKQCPSVKTSVHYNCNKPTLFRQLTTFNFPLNDCGSVFNRFQFNNIHVRVHNGFMNRPKYNLKYTKNPTELHDPDQISNRKVEAFCIDRTSLPTGK